MRQSLARLLDRLDDGQRAQILSAFELLNSILT
jgi:hypothetical protein